MTITEQTHELGKLIKESEEMAAYKAAEEAQMNDEEAKKLLQEFNKEATKPCFYGFVFDSTPVQQQIAAVKTVEEQYAALVSCGATDVEPTLTEFREKLKKAGVQDIIDEVQKQYDAFKAKK